MEYYRLFNYNFFKNFNFNDHFNRLIILFLYFDLIYQYVEHIQAVYYYLDSIVRSFIQLLNLLISLAHCLILIYHIQTTLNTYKSIKLCNFTAGDSLKLPFFANCL